MRPLRINVAGLKSADWLSFRGNIGGSDFGLVKTWGAIFRGVTKLEAEGLDYPSAKICSGEVRSAEACAASPRVEAFPQLAFAAGGGTGTPIPPAAPPRLPTGAPTCGRVAGVTSLTSSTGEIIPSAGTSIFAAQAMPFITKRR